MEKVLKTLFDLQKFSGNPHLASLIKETENRYSNEIDDDDLAFVSAAGEIDTTQKKSPFSKGEHGDD